MREFIQFVMVTREEAYPVVWAESPLYDVSGEEVSCAVDHAARLIEISPAITDDELEDEVAYATQLAANSYPIRKVPLVGEVD